MKPPFDWTEAYHDHLRWLWAVKPELSKATMASRIGISLETLKHKQAQLELPRHTYGRKKFFRHSTEYQQAGTLGELLADETSYDEKNYAERQAEDGSTRLLTLLRRHHDVTKVVTVVTRAQVAQLPSWPFR